ncbi:MAG: sigma-70 family RNA polymerase sigma factor [candidate division Zixibacteria bacterium]|jgi:RNA polymerase sigma-70 factor (ECF subfamily)|nr:sigma-70 family RNA polymerase sigma factor [candidate division Zixibacteria bacterium]
MENAAQLNPRVAFEQMAVEYREQLLRYALSLTGDQSISEDLLQDTYLKALRAFGMFRVGSNFRAWINKIMLNTFINYYNRNKRSPLDYGLELYDHEATGETNKRSQTEFYVNLDESSLLDYFTSDEIRKALLSLSADYRNCIIMADMMGLTYREISYLSGCPMGTIRSRLSRARYMLKRKLLKAGFASAS